MNAEYPPKCDDCGPDGFHAADCFYRDHFATFRTTCSRCNTEFQGTAAEINAVSKAHEERCFVVGDWVRACIGASDWAEGEIAMIDSRRRVHIRVSATDPGWPPAVVGSVKEFMPSTTIRRIPRPEQAVKPVVALCDRILERHDKTVRHLAAPALTTCYRGGSCNMPPSGGPCVDCGYPRAYARAEDISGALEVDAVYVNGTALVIIVDHQMTPGFVRVVQRRNYECADHPIPTIANRDIKPSNIPPDFETERRKLEARTAPAQTLHDGLTSAECFTRWSTNRRLVESGFAPEHAMTPDQIGVAKWTWEMQFGRLRSDVLRCRIEEGKERERLTVMGPDLELETANCKDAE